MNKTKLKSKLFWIGSVLSIITLLSVITVSICSITNKQTKSTYKNTEKNIKNINEAKKLLNINNQDLNTKHFINKKLKVNDPYLIFKNLTNFIEINNIDCKFDEQKIINNINHVVKEIIKQNGLNITDILICTKYEIKQNKELNLDIRWTNKINDTYNNFYYCLLNLKITN